MRILVLGGTRFIGLAAVTELAADGHDVAVFHRGKSNAVLPSEVTQILGDRRDLWFHREPLLQFGAEVVIDMLAMTEADMLRVQELFREQVRRLVVISSCDVYRAYGVLLGKEKEEGYTQPTPLREESELRRRLYPFREAQLRRDDDARAWLDDYDKILVERAAHSDPDLPATVLRLPMVYGPRDGQHRLFPYLKRMDDGRPAILLSATDAGRRFARGFVGNVAHAVAMTAVREDGDAFYNVADEPSFTEVEWVEAIAKAAGWAGRIVVLPDGSLPEDMRGMTPQDLDVDTHLIRAQLGFSEPVKLDDALAQTVDWEREHLPEFDPAQFDYALEDRLLAGA
jgi:nucleoside-diphosphate-sugar epimerase